jgi:hypothetical protein
MDGWVHGVFEMGALATQHNGEYIGPLALSFAKVFKIQF